MDDRIVIFDTDTPSGQAQLQIAQDRLAITGLFKNLNVFFKRIAAFVWKNPLGLTPQQVFDLYGTKAFDLVKLSMSYQAMLETYTGVRPSVVPEGFDLTVNADGTVTVVTLPPAEPQ